MARKVEFDREKALITAMNLFWCNGYEGTSISDLTSAIGIKPGSLYNTFEDKRTLYLEALNYYQQNVGSWAFEVLADDSISGKQAIRQVFENVVTDILEDVEQKGCFVMNATLERLPHDREVATIARSSAVASRGLFRKALERSQIAGELNSEHDIEQLASFFVSSVQGLRATGKSNLDRSVLMGIVHVILSVLNS